MIAVAMSGGVDSSRLRRCCATAAKRSSFDAIVESAPEAGQSIDNSGSGEADTPAADAARLTTSGMRGVGYTSRHAVHV
jgi:hypothetical protein